jgi:tetraacyldisaccharide 4'-kinase
MGKLENYWRKIIYKRENIFEYLIFFIFLIFSKIYIFFWEIYLKLYDLKILKREKFNLKIVSVGNITLGGTGKTSFVKTIAEFLKEKNIQFVILSRGYKSKKTHQNFVVKNDSLPSEVGDEPYLLFKELKVPVIIGKNRNKSVKFSLRNFSPSIVILDDGFQYQKLEKNLEIVLVDASLPFGNYKIFPAGILRENLSSLKRADLIILTKVDQIEKREKENLMRIIKKYTNSPILESIYVPLYLKDFFNNCFSLELIKGENVVCFSGIGNFSSFVKTVEKLGVKNIIEIEFPDHYFYKRKDIEEIKLFQKKNGFKVITTEKDAVRIEKEVISECKYFFILVVEMRIISGEEIIKKMLFQ